MKSKKNEAVFAADPEGWRAMNAGRPAAHLLRELVQNVFDEAATELHVHLHRESFDTAAAFSVTDDVPGGIRDERLIWTLFASDKTDEPTKRGRMGRGLKELIAVADETLIKTESGPALLFRRSRGKWARTNPKMHRPARGTQVVGHCKAWGIRDVKEAVAYLRQMRPPEQLMLMVNNERVQRKPASETYQLKLPTVVYEQEADGRVERQRTRVATVELFEERDEQGAPASWVYEMGIPVERIDFPLSIDVGQRIPLREKRDTMTEPYRRELFAKLLDVRLPLLRPEQLRDNFVLTAAAAFEHLTETTKRSIVEAWTEGRAFARTPADFTEATSQHVEAVQLRSLPESVRDLTREVGTDVRQVLEERLTAACSPVLNLSTNQARLTRVWEAIALGIKRPCRVALYHGRPGASASFHRESRTLRVYVENVGAAFIANPLSTAALSLLIHELAHWEPHEHGHGFDFHSDAEDVGGAVAAWLWGNREAVEVLL